jgi:VWFA-related protein
LKKTSFTRKEKGLTLSICLLLFIPAAYAQVQSRQSIQQPFTVKVDAQLVVEDVVVKNKDGKIMEGLSAQDFTVIEDGVLQTISVFQFQRLEGTPEMTQGTSPAEQPVTTVRPLKPAQITPPPPGDERYRNRRLLVLFFDLSAMPPSDQLRALGAADRFIRTQMKPLDLLALMVFDSKDAVRVFLDFTDERNQLLDALQRLNYLDNNAQDASDKGSAFDQDDNEFNIFNTDRKLAALQTAVNMLKAIGGQKALVYFTSGLRLASSSNQAQLSATTNAAIRANVAFFPVDARGLVASPPLGDATQKSPGGTGMYSGAETLASFTGLQSSQDTLFTLAGDTSGKAMLDNNDLAAGIVQAEQAITSYYVIGYHPVNSALDGKFRRVKITLKEGLSAKLEFRQGYFAAKTFKTFTPSDKERQLEDALLLDDPITDIPIAMEVNYFKLNLTEYFVSIAVKIPGSALVQGQIGGGVQTLIDFIGEVKDDGDRTIQALRDKVAIKIGGKTAGGLSKRPIQYETAFILPPGGYVMKFLARDSETGLIGTYRASFVIPNLIREGSRIPISSVVLSSQRVDVKKTISSAANGKNSTQAARAVNPLVDDGQVLIPSVTRVFSRTREMYVYLQAYESDEPKAHPLVAFVTFYHGQTRAFETSPVQFHDALDPKSTAMPLRFTLSLSKLPPGDYTFQVTVLDPEGQKVAFWNAPIMIVP